MAKSTGRSRPYLAAEAISEYLAVNEWQVAGIKQAILSLERGEGLPHDQLKDSVDSLGQRKRKAGPEASPMMPVWSPEAMDDLIALRTHIAPDDPTAARRVVLHIVHVVETLLAANPGIGRPGRVPGRREFVISRTLYILPYRLRQDAIELLRV